MFPFEIKHLYGINDLEILVLIPSRGKYFPERASICEGHFWCALGQNSWFLVGKLQNFDNFIKTTTVLTPIITAPFVLNALL